jgi:hypothetical protein
MSDGGTLPRPKIVPSREKTFVVWDADVEPRSWVMKCDSDGKFAMPSLLPHETITLLTPASAHEVQKRPF